MTGATLNPLDHPICLTRSEYLSPVTAWSGHLPFAFTIIDLCRPKVVVELGTHYGNSFFAFCQAVRNLGLETRCHAVDTWMGDPHAGYYGDKVFEMVRTYRDERCRSFAELHRMTFDEALPRFPDGGVDLLHIDGLHTYEAVRHDFESWLPKLSGKGVVLFHDTAVREGDFGVWRLWEELRPRYPHFEFMHSHGLGVLSVGTDAPPNLDKLTKAHESNAETIRSFFATLGGLWLEIHQGGIACAKLAENLADMEAGKLKIEGRLAKIEERLAHRTERLTRIERSLLWKLAKPLRWAGLGPR